METRNIVLITGVSRKEGLGYETARQLAEQGYKVIITARDYQKATQLAAIMQGDQLDIVPMELDINNADSIAKCVQQVTAQFGHLDVLINNAGAMTDLTSTIATADLGVVKSCFDSNVFGPWQTTQAFLPLLRKSAQPRIVNVTSGMGSYDDPDFGLNHFPGVLSTYALAKLTFNALTVKVAKELKDKKILVNAVCPGFTATYEGLKEQGARPVEESAKSIVWAATLPANGPTGGFFRDGKPLPW
ncbi:SDR family NAD(P)-dependent oxidoreductase [Chitinophaga filiformis]|uniref:SDR family NAD(P)-dependent oxidoreductase n=1 Tax=Chitinophaga filiformis TaxID=104663 RepID=UPI001F3C2BE7|nr:SDR family NAD(P)-dependent oxidoreductase [Chitinophaga filiformis]MCF6402447.1 SDR family NAD(P)-dependent oxidoreductase [Chitinophaga filiformis]